MVEVILTCVFAISQNLKGDIFFVLRKKDTETFTADPNVGSRPVRFGLHYSKPQKVTYRFRVCIKNDWIWF